MNLVVLSGRVSTDMVVHYTQKGTSVVVFDIAVRKSFTRDAEGNYPTDFFHVVAWNKLADSCQKNLIKGRMVLVRGCIANDKYEDEQKTIHRKTIIKASMVEFLDSRKNPSGHSSEAGNNVHQTASPEPDAEISAASIPDEEIPF